MGVRGNLVVDRESECKRFAACLSGNAGLCSRANSIQEIFELEAKGFAFGDVRPGEGEACGGVLTVRGRGGLGGGAGSGGDRGGCREGRRTCSGRCPHWGRNCSGDCGCDDGWINADGQKFLAGEVE